MANDVASGDRGLGNGSQRLSPRRELVPKVDVAYGLLRRAVRHMLDRSTLIDGAQRRVRFEVKQRPLELVDAVKGTAHRVENFARRAAALTRIGRLS
jgi:hypothetical protein